MQRSGGHQFAVTSVFTGLAREYRVPVYVEYPGKTGNREIVAIWDTGATDSSMSKRMSDELRLPIDGYAVIHTASETIEDAPLHIVDIRFRDGTKFSNLFVSVTDLSNIDMIIGTDIISQGDFHVSNVNGQTIVTFGVPSIDAVDYLGGSGHAKR